MNTAALSFSLSGIVLSWVVLFGLYPGYRTDALRHRLAVLRDELFDLAAAGLVPFSDPAYLHLCATLLAAIRSADRLTFSRVALIATARRLLPGRISQPGEGPWDAGRGEAPRELASIHERVELLIARHMVALSPLGWLWLLRAAAKSLATGQGFRFWSDWRQLLPNPALLALVIQTTTGRSAARAQPSAERTQGGG